MPKVRGQRGFTLVELMVALIVTGIIMSAVATLAFAFRSAYDVTDDTDRKQAQLRYATLRISELIRHCKLICAVTDGDLVIWRDDDVPGGKDQINIEEIVYIEKDNNQIRILDFPNSPSWLSSSLEPLGIDWIQSDWLKTMLKTYCDEETVVAVPECNNVQFQFDASPPRSKFVSISFELTENGSARQYQIDGALRCWAGHLLNAASTDLTSDDD
jgi:prepilin-type N-terminal cleavage/methylation domain-containing protein